MSDPVDAETRLKRLRLRSMRRGILEMDLILQGFAEARLAELGPRDLAVYEELLGENDQDLYAWIAGREPAPDRYSGIVAEIASTLQRN